MPEDVMPVTTPENNTSPVSTETNPAPSSAPETTPVTPSTVKIKYNHEEREIPLSEAIMLAQKGIDYDRTRPAYDRLLKQAQAEGFDSVKAYTDYLDSQPAKIVSAEPPTSTKPKSHAEIMKELTDSGVDAETADLKATVMELQAKQNAREAVEQTAAQKQAALDRYRKSWEAVKKEFPEDFSTIKDGKIPEEITALIDSGAAETPIEAYRLVDNRRKAAKIAELEAQIAAGNANAAGAAAAAGSMTSESAAEKEFYTSEEWDNLDKATQRKLIRSGKIDKIMEKWRK